MFIEIDPKYNYILTKLALEEDRENFILKIGLESLELMYQNFLTKGINKLGLEAVGKTADQILEFVEIAPPVKMSNNPSIGNP